MHAEHMIRSCRPDVKAADRSGIRVRAGVDEVATVARRPSPAARDP
jgi:hypothetical protein